MSAKSSATLSTPNQSDQLTMNTRCVIFRATASGLFSSAELSAERNAPSRPSVTSERPGAAMNTTALERDEL